MTHQKFDETAAVKPYPYIGAVARSDPNILKCTIDAMVSDPNNVPQEEALSVWGLPEKSYQTLKSHSATDVSECAFKYYGGDIHRFQNVVGANVWDAWNLIAQAAGDSVKVLIHGLESEYAAREIRKIDITHALFHLGRQLDSKGSVRNAMIYKSSLLASKAAKHYIETGKSIEGQAITAHDAAVASSKKDSAKRKRTTPVVQRQDQCNVRYTMLVSQLRDKGLELSNTEEERAFIEKGPVSLGKIMANIDIGTSISTI